MTGEFDALALVDEGLRNKDLVTAPIRELMGVVNQIRHGRSGPEGEAILKAFVRRLDEVDALRKAHEASLVKRLDDEIRAKQQAKDFARENRMQAWNISHAYRWMLEPVLQWDENAEVFVREPLTSDVALVDAVRACTREWMAGDRRRKLHAHLFDWLSHHNMDWESIVRWEFGLESEFVDGVRAPFLDGAFQIGMPTP